MQVWNEAEGAMPHTNTTYLSASLSMASNDSRFRIGWLVHADNFFNSLKSMRSIWLTRISNLEHGTMEVGCTYGGQYPRSNT